MKIKLLQTFEQKNEVNSDMQSRESSKGKTPKVNNKNIRRCKLTLLKILGVNLKQK